jgi:hypothetical protein
MPAMDAALGVANFRYSICISSISSLLDDPGIDYPDHLAKSKEQTCQSLVEEERSKEQGDNDHDDMIVFCQPG